MKKRILSILLALVMLVGLMPVQAAAASDDAYEKEVRAAVSQVLKDYAKKVYQAGADDQAFKDFFRFGFFGNGRTVKLNEKSAQVAALFNSYLLQESLTNCITAGIIKAQAFGKDAVYTVGGTSWHNYAYSYYHNGYTTKGTEISKYSGSLGALSQTKDIYGPGGYPGARNANDEVQELLTGGLTNLVDIVEKEMIGDRAVYTITIKVSDTFDFTGSYEDLTDKGYDVSKDEDLKDMGWLMTHLGLDEFFWSFTTPKLEVEVPYNCDHKAHNYHWLLDLETVMLNNLIEDEFEANPAIRNEYQYTSTTTGEEKVRYYFELEEPILLTHDRPWVMELEQTGLNTHQFGTAATGSAKFYTSGSSYIWIPFSKKMTMSDGTQKTISQYVGVKTTWTSKYKKDHRYTITLENVVNADGSNMIYASIYDHDLDEQVMAPEAMNDLWYRLPEDTSLTRKETECNYVNGLDLIIGFLGTKSAGWGAETEKELELRIWEEGKNPVPDVGVPTEPTCTRPGGNRHYCNDCDGTYLTEIIPALGHSYGEYVGNDNADCVNDATKTRVCTRCGEKDTVAIPDTALGHSFGEYVYDNNSSCTEDGTQTRKCTVCGVKETVHAPETALGHEYKSVVTAPTLTAEGYTTYTCTRCGDSYKDDFVPKKEHTYVGVVTEPTCTEQGFTTYTCSECGDTYVADYTDMIEHTPVIDPAVEPTCVEKGKTEGSHCGVCGFVIKKQANISTVDRHDYEEEITKIPTYDEDGEVTYTCKDCGKTEVKTIPAFEKPTPKNPFTDVSEADWFYGPVIWALKEGVTGGKTETTFAPNEGCTRAQVVTFLWAANGKPEPESMENPFNDVASDAWYLKPVLWAVEQGITGGVAEGMFGPEQTCTRAQIATFLWAANGKHAVNSESTFVDVTGGEWYATPVIWAVENDVTSGIGEGKFGPTNTCTRAQVVTFLYKVYG